MCASTNNNYNCACIKTGHVCLEADVILVGPAPQSGSCSCFLTLTTSSISVQAFSFTETHLFATFLLNLAISGIASRQIDCEPCEPCEPSKGLRCAISLTGEHGREATYVEGRGFYLVESVKGMRETSGEASLYGLRQRPARNDQALPCGREVPMRRRRWASRECRNGHEEWSSNQCL